MADRTARLQELQGITGDSRIEELENCTLLNLSGRNLTSVPLGVWDLTSLLKLGLHGNRLSSLPPEVSRLATLARLSAYWNQLSSLPREISRLTGLTCLEVHNNQLSSLPQEISRLSGLISLHVGNNQLSFLPPEISQLSALEVLWVQNNPIEELPPQITALTKLKYLFIEYEGNVSIKRAPSGITGLPCWGCTDNKDYQHIRALQLYDLVTTPTQARKNEYRQTHPTPIHLVYLHQGQQQFEADPGQYSPLLNIPSPLQLTPQATADQFSYPHSPSHTNRQLQYGDMVRSWDDPNSEPVTGDYADVMTIGSEHVQKVGEGGYGTAYRVQLKKGIVAVKVLKKKAKPGTAEYNELTKEAKMMLNLRHENIISLYAFGCRNQEIMYVMEYADGNSVWDMIEANGALPFDKYIRYSIQINAGLKYLHSQTPPVEHRDLKPENVLLCNGVAKICDFGTSSARETISRTTGFKGTFHYAAPEYFDAMKGYGPMSDMYTFGLVVWAMTAGKRPYDDMNYGQIMAQKLHGNLPLIPPATPPKFALLMNECWNYNACHRPSAADLEVRLVDISKNPTSPPLALKTKSVRNMSIVELVKYLEDKNANPDLIRACKERKIGGAEFVILTEEDLKELVPGFMSVHIRAALNLIAEATRS